MTNFVYALYGTEERRWAEFFYSLGTLRLHCDHADSRVVVYTDRPERLRSAPVSCHDITEDIAATRSQDVYPYRLKLVTILKCAQQYDGNVFYLDTDTIVQGDIATRAARLAPGCGLMWKKEGVPGWIAKYNNFQTQLPDGSHYHCPPKPRMYNSGAVGLHRHDIGVLPLALALCDAFWQHDRKNRVCEQFALTEAMRISGLKILEASDIVIHYYRVSFQAYMHERLRQFNAQLSGPPWEFQRPFPASYARVQLAKLRRKWKF
jgi:hypothetical protein